MPKYTSRDRKEWIAWYVENGQNVSATARRFGIDHETVELWVRTSGGKVPRRKLDRKPRRTRWTGLDLSVVAELNMRHPEFGEARMHALMVDYGLQYSARTVGTMLKNVKEMCPVCGGKHEHWKFRHEQANAARRRNVDWYSKDRARRT